MTSSSSNSELVLLHQLLQDVELEQFATKIVEELQVSRISHFDYVTTEDLMGIGMGKPAARRLLDTVKKRKGTLKKKLIQTFISQSANSNNKDLKGTLRVERIPEEQPSVTGNLTCLIKESDLKLGVQLGDGSFGIVHKGEWIRPDGSTVAVAVKVLKEDVIQQQAVYEDFVREVEAMHTLQHPCMIRLHGVVLSHPLMMVTELAPLGSLLDYLHKQCSHISICSLWQYASQVASGMAFLESRRLLHRDLACRNIFLTSSSQAKIGDFGLLRPLPEGSDCYLMTEQRRVPFPWCAPESLKYRKFSLATDVWMFGIALWEMFTFGDEPWAGLGGHEILNKIDKKGERLMDPQAAPESICKLMQRCWSADPACRPRFSEIASELTSNSPLLVRCRSEDKQEPQWDEPAGAHKLEMVEGDQIAVINGRPDCYWWTGQNQRTFSIGIFPRCWTEPLRRRNGEDISRPLRHSFIHTGHGSSSGQSWGSPAAIDEVYLRNPMEPSDILGLKNAPGFSGPDSPQRGVEIIKSKRQFSYSRLNEDRLDSPVAAAAATVPRNEPATPREEPLLIDLSAEPSGPPKPLVNNNNNHLIPFSVPQPEPIDQSRLYENCLYENCPTAVSPTPYPPSVSGPAASSQSDIYGGPHYYSEVPFEPLTPVLPPPPSKPTSPVSPMQPVVTEELRKKRDEAFDWLGHALGQMSLPKGTRSSSSSADQYSLPFKINPPSAKPTSSHGFEDDFAAGVQPSNGAAASQPHYPKPGSWPDHGAVASPPGTTHWEQLIASRIAAHHSASVQTAHVRPFVVATPFTTSQTDSGSAVDRSNTPTLFSQVQQSAPWASEQEVKQAIVISNNNLLEAVRFLQVEKLYRLGLCSKAVCVKALQATNWNLEKAASTLLDA